DDRVELRACVLEAEIGVARRVGPTIAGDLAAHPHIAEPVLDRALERVRQLADGDFWSVGSANVRLSHRGTMPDGAHRGETRFADEAVAERLDTAVTRPHSCRLSF